MKLIIVRHGETEANVARRYLGQCDSSLTAEGREQARNAAMTLKGSGIEAIYSSDLPRAIISASYLAEHLGLPVVTDERLRELNFGLIEHMTYEEAMNRYPVEVTRWYSDWESNSPPGGESLCDLRHRVWSFLNEIQPEYD